MEPSDSAKRVVSRFLEATEGPFQGLFDLDHTLLTSRGHGWKKEPSKSDQESYIKRFGGIWFRLSWDTGIWSTQAYLSPTRMLRISPTDEAWYETWREALDKVSEHFPVKGLTLADIERKALELAKVYKELAGPRKKRDTSEIWYVPRKAIHGESTELTGDEAIKAWRTDVENVLQEVIDDGASRGIDYTTASLAMNILNNYGLKLHGASRRDEGRFIRAILESMAKRNKIEKDTNAREPRWVGLNYKSKPTYGW